MHNSKAKTSIWAGISMIILPIYTIIFATRKSPLEYTMSKIGNHFGWENYISFIIWGIVSAVCLSSYITFIFRKADFKNRSANRFLIGSVIALILTVLTPSTKELFPFLSFMHILYSLVSSAFLILSLLLFVFNLQRSDYKLPRYTVYLLITTVLLPAIAWFLLGLNGLVEMTFIVLVSVSLVVINRNLDI